MHYLHDLNTKLHGKYIEFRAHLHPHNRHVQVSSAAPTPLNLQLNLQSIFDTHLPPGQEEAYIKTARKVEENSFWEDCNQDPLTRSISLDPGKHFDPGKHRAFRSVVDYIENEIHSSIFKNIEWVCERSCYPLPSDEWKQLKEDLKEDLHRRIDREVSAVFFKGQHKYIECSSYSEPAQWLKKMCDKRFEKFKWHYTFDILDIDPQLSFYVEMSSTKDGFITVTKTVHDEMKTTGATQTIREFRINSNKMNLPNSPKST